MQKSFNKYFLICLVTVIGMTSCSDITNNIYVDKNGDVTTEFSLTPHTFFPEDMFSEMMGESPEGTDEFGAFDVEEEDVEATEEYGEVEEEGFMEKIMSGIVQLDTSFSITETEDFEEMRDSFPFDAFFQSAVVSYKGDTIEGTSNLTMSLGLAKDQYHGYVGVMDMLENDEEALDRLADNAEKGINTRENLINEMAAVMETAGERTSIFWDKGVFVMPRLNMEKLGEMSKMADQEDSDSPIDDLGGDFGGMADEIDMDDEFTREMMNNMFGRLVTKIHLPGKVEFTNSANAIIDGNTVIFDKPIMEVMLDNKNSEDIIIKFKK